MELLGRQPDLGSPVLLAYGWPRDTARDMVVLTGSAPQIDQEWFSVGAHNRDELFELDLVVSVIDPGWTQQETNERAFVLLAAVEAALRASPTLSVAPGVQGPVIWCGIKPQKLTVAATPEGREAFLTCVIGCRARI